MSATGAATAARRQAGGQTRTRYAAVRPAYPLPRHARRAGNPLSPDGPVLADRRSAGGTPAPLKGSNFADRLTASRPECRAKQRGAPAVPERGSFAGRPY